MHRAIVDTGPLVALLSARDTHHQWARSSFATIAPPGITCEAVLAEAWHLLRGTARGQSALLELLAGGTLTIEFGLMAELAAVRRLVSRYKDQPMSLADACMVRLAEIYDEASVITLDRDFAVYRKNGRQVIPLISPFA
ncbi:MAG: PIN domain-containing protein [Burkholderiales bacterium]|jgi:predicted nucleic acid-binding protein|nr:PIN domain-containing protein [Burkholderiales bacterium]